MASALMTKLGCIFSRLVGFKSLSKKRGRWMKLTQYTDDWNKARRSETTCMTVSDRCSADREMASVVPNSVE